MRCPKLKQYKDICVKRKRANVHEMNIESIIISNLACKNATGRFKVGVSTVVENDQTDQTA